MKGVKISSVSVTRKRRICKLLLKYAVRDDYGSSFCKSLTLSLGHPSKREKDIPGSRFNPLSLGSVHACNSRSVRAFWDGSWPYANCFHAHLDSREKKKGLQIPRPPKARISLHTLNPPSPLPVPLVRQVHSAEIVSMLRSCNFKALRNAQKKKEG